MSVVVDPVASLRRWELEVTLADRTYPLRSASAAEWMAVLLDNPIDLSLILPGMLAHESDEEELEEAMLSGRITAAEIQDVALEMVSAAAGRDWWWVTNLLATVASVWMEVYGALVAKGFNAENVPFGAALDALYSECVTSRLDKERRKMFDQQLEIRPATSPEQIDEEKEAASFLAMLNGG